MKLSTRLHLPLLLIAFALAAPVRAGPLEDGMAAYREKDYVKAVELWRPLAEAGDAVAQYQLGVLYAEGKGVAHDDALAAVWFRRSALQGNANAQYDLAASYSEGVGVDKDEAEAAKWFRRAADQRMGFAQLNLGMLYASGRGVPKDSVEALKWMELAVYSLPAGGARSDAAKAMKDVADAMTAEQILDAKGRAKLWRPPPDAGAPVVEAKGEAKSEAKAQPNPGASGTPEKKGAGTAK
jgi:TPR repeat protein